MAVAPGVIRGERTLSQVASDHGVAPSLACEWRDQLVGAAGGVFGKAASERERKRSEEAARREREEALRTIGRLTPGRDFLRRFLDGRGYGPGARGGRRQAAGGPGAREGPRAAGRAREHRPPRAQGRPRGPGRGGRAEGPPHGRGARRSPRARRAQAGARAHGRPRGADDPVEGARPHEAHGHRARLAQAEPLKPPRQPRRFPYLLRGKEVLFPNQVWSPGITCARLGGRHMRLTAITGWPSRHVVGWRPTDAMRACEVVVIICAILPRQLHSELRPLQH